MDRFETIASIRDFVNSQRKANKKVALVPTMGALHEGHLSLVHKAREVADTVIVSIFVNPKQFGQNEDYDTYPNTIEADSAKLTELGVDAVYLPKASEMYPEHFLTTIHVAEVTEGLCSMTRPHFFDGVAIVVTKLLMQTLPDYAIFGEKDYQQLMMVQKLVQDLNIPTQIVGAAIIREKDGLAMSSRNVYLSDQERAIAPSLYRIIMETKDRIIKNQAIEQILSDAKNALVEAGFKSVDYYELRNAVTLESIKMVQPALPMRLIAAARLDSCRLIDNIALNCN